MTNLEECILPLRLELSGTNSKTADGFLIGKTSLRAVENEAMNSQAIIAR